MTLAAHEFNNVSLLITHYNRGRSLERLLKAFSKLHIRFGEIIVSDDGSKKEHLDLIEFLQHQYNFRLITSPVNKGLGHNINKGQDAVTKAYTLYVQEDFEPAEIFAEHFKDALDMMEERKDFDIARFYAYFDYPYARPYKKGFSEMVFHPGPWYTNHLKFYYYSDHPHLRRSNFLQKFGRYPEGIKGDETEYKMAISFIQKKGRGLFYNDFTQLFYQKNSAAEPSTMNRSDWRQSRNLFILLLRSLYLQGKLIRSTLDLIFMKQQKLT
jgi:glycosyltransferase involved in cell wall biosynthesis